jgi:hypothetical protein
VAERVGPVYRLKIHSLLSLVIRQRICQQAVLQNLYPADTLSVCAMLVHRFSDLGNF